MRIEIRKTDVSDMEDIIAFSDDMLNRYEDFNSIDREKAIGWTHKVIRDNIENYATIIADGHKAGYYLLTQHQDIFEIYHLFIYPRFQGKGIGTGVVQRLLAETDEKLQVHVYTGDIASYQFFEHCGFHTKEIFHRTRYKMIYGENDDEQ